MSISKETREGRLHLIVEGPMTAAFVAKLRSELLDCLKERERVVIRTEKVDDCDTLGVQLLLSLRRSFPEDPGKISFGEISPAIREAFRSCGMEPDCLEA